MNGYFVKFLTYITPDNRGDRVYHLQVTHNNEGLHGFEDFLHILALSVYSKTHNITVICDPWACNDISYIEIMFSVITIVCVLRAMEESIRLTTTLENDPINVLKATLFHLVENGMQ